MRVLLEVDHDLPDASRVVAMGQMVVGHDRREVRQAVAELRWPRLRTALQQAQLVPSALVEMVHCPEVGLQLWVEVVRAVQTKPSPQVAVVLAMAQRTLLETSHQSQQQELG